MDGVVFTEGEADIDLFPIGAVDSRPKDELAADQAFFRTQIGPGLAGFRREPETPDQNLQAARLVDEVDRASGERLTFVGDQGVARKGLCPTGRSPEPHARDPLRVSEGLRRRGAESTRKSQLSLREGATIQRLGRQSGR